MDQLDKYFAVTLKALREREGLTQEKLALISGLDRTYISLLERGLRTPTVKTLWSSCSALNIDPSEFVLKLEVAFQDGRVEES